MTDTSAARHTLSWSEAFGRLEEFRRLAPNWDSYGADEISHVALVRARELLRALMDNADAQTSALCRPVNVVPIADGGVQLEWDRGDAYFEVEIDSGGEIEYLVARGSGSERRSSGGRVRSVAEAVPLVASFVNASAVWQISS